MGLKKEALAHLAFSPNAAGVCYQQVFWEVVVRQVGRFFVKPQQFVNQLQWSTHHWWILFSFLVMTGIEAHVGSQQALYQVYAGAISRNFGLGNDLSLWMVICAKLAFIMLGAVAVSWGIWFVGNYLGRHSSQRVLFRRLAIVFTLMMTAYTGQHLQGMYPWMETASVFLYFWSGLLGYFAVREQFELTHLESAFVTLFATFLILTSWNYSNRTIEKNATTISTQIAKLSTLLTPTRPH